MLVLEGHFLEYHVRGTSLVLLKYSTVSEILQLESIVSLLWHIKLKYGQLNMKSSDAKAS